MSNTESLKRYVASIMGDDYLEAGNGELRYECGNCKKLGKTYEDKKLYVSCNKGLFFCFRCGLKGSLSYNRGMFTSNVEAYDVITEFLQEGKNIVDDDCDMYLVPAHRPKAGSLAYEYLVYERGIPEQDLFFYDLRVGDLKNNFGRVVVPNEVFDYIWTDMYVARSYIGKEPKYLNPGGANRKGVVFNLHRIPQNPSRIVIVEGAFDALSAGKDAVAVYGKYVSNLQLTKILQKNPRSVYVSLDHDAREQAEQLCSRIYATCSTIPIYLVDMPEGTDPNDVGMEVYRSHYLANAQRYESPTAYLLHRFLELK